jgi:cytochrome c oxidase assembly protein subunit 15
MLGSLALVVLLSIMVFRMRTHHENYAAIPKRLKTLAFSLIVLIFIQISLGTQVREQVDVVAKITNDRDAWIGMLPSIFLVHRSFSILLVLVAIVIYWAMQRMVMPALAQPLHILLGVLCFALSFYAWMRIRFSTSS